MTTSSRRLTSDRPDTRALVREGFLFLLVLATSRLALLLVLGHLVQGREFTDDYEFQVRLIEDPLQLLRAERTSTAASFPPLFPLLLALLGSPLTAVASPFYALRLTFIGFELAAWPALWSVVCVAKPAARRLLGAVYVTAPMSWMATTVMCQEEALALLFFAVMSWLLLRGRLVEAIFVCSLGVVTAKVFFLVPLSGLVLGPPLRPWRRSAVRLLCASLPLVAVYGVVTLHCVGYGRPLPLLGFTPQVANSISIWNPVSDWFGMTALEAKRLSLLPSLAGALAPLAIWKARGQVSEGLPLLQLVSAMLAWAFVLFYHVNGEYYLMLVPGIFALFAPRWAVALVWGGLAVPWVTNVFYGVYHAMDAPADSGKAFFVRTYQEMCSLSPGVWMHVSTLAFVAIAVGVAVWLTKGLGSTTATGAPLPSISTARR